jgi:nucleoside-diphosphate-sugar epimerase
MRILITGGAGCLGSNLIEHWLPEGHEIFVIDNFATGKREVLEGIEGLSVVEGSIADAALVNRCFDEFQPTHVVHSAAAYKDPNDWEEDTRTNVLGTVNVVKASQRRQVARLIYFQTALCYGRPEEVPIPVSHPTRPFTSYGISKTAGESYVISSGLSAVSLRLANVCGPRLAIGPIPTFYKRLKAGQECFCSDAVRDFLDMSDFLSVMDRVIHADAPRGVFNVSTGRGHSIKDIFDVVADHLGLKGKVDAPVVPVGEDDVPAVVLDPSETVEKLGWQAEVSFEETIRRQLEWYDRYGVNDIFSHLARPKK